MPDEMPSEIPSLKRNRSWIITGLLLVVLMGGLSFCSRWFENAQSIYGGDVLLIVSLLVISGGIYLFQMRLLKRTHGGKALLIWVLIVGAAMRVLVLPSVPILEVDMYRYMWDGAVTAKGISPYVYSPRDISSLTEADHTPVEKALKGLVGESEGVFARINHGEYTTVYPPLAEAFFAAAYWVKPFSLLGLRVVFLVFDLLTLGVLALLLRRVGSPLTSIAVYWWNPLLVKEIVNSVHMDVLAFPFVLMGIFFLSRSRLFLSALSIVLAGALKLWPLALLPLILSQALFRPRRLALLVTMILALCVLIFFPFLMSALAGDSGLLAYAQKWQSNDAFFSALLFVSESFLGLISVHPGYGQPVARIMTYALIGIVIFFVSSPSAPAAPAAKNQKEIVNKVLIITAAIFLLSPAQFPWYFTWLIPLLALEMNFALLALTALLPLYYLRYYFEPGGELAIFENVVVWVEFVPIWLLLMWGWMKRRQLASG